MHRVAHNSDLEQRARYAQTQRERGVPLDTINALHIFSFPDLPLVGHQKECMNEFGYMFQITSSYNCSACYIAPQSMPYHELFVV